MGTIEFKSPSMKRKLSGSGFQVSGVFAPAVLLTLRILRLYSTPDPFSGMKSSAKADTRRVLIGPAPGRMFAVTFQFPPPVSPAVATYGAAKVTTVSLKVKSPWKPT